MYTVYLEMYTVYLEKYTVYICVLGISQIIIIISLEPCLAGDIFGTICFPLQQLISL